MRCQKSKLLSQLADLDSSLEEGVLIEEDIVTKATTFMECVECLKNEEMARRQRSTAFWIKEGDRNTKFLVEQWVPCLSWHAFGSKIKIQRDLEPNYGQCEKKLP